MKNTLILLVILTGSLLASPLSETVGDPASTTPFSQRMFGTSASATYFNPALLSGMKKCLSLSTFYTYQNLHISYGTRPDSADIVGNKDMVSGIYGARISAHPDRGLPFKPLPTDQLYHERGSTDNTADNLYASLGLVLPIVEDHLAFGVYALLPVGKLQQQGTFFVDEREQYFSNSLHFELYEDRMTSQTIAAALGGRYRWFSVGAGVSVTTNAEVNAEIFSQDTSTKMDLTTNSEFGTAFTPYFGLEIQPWKALFLTATLHLPSQGDIDSENNISFWGGSEGLEAMENTTLAIAYGYKPLTVGIGAGITDMEITENVSLSAGVSTEFRNWSAYRNRYNENPRDITYWDWRETSISGDYEKDGAWVTETVAHYAWKDTWSMVAGTSVSVGNFSAGIDAAYVPSPVPEQDGRTNYVDNDKLNLGTGIQYTFSIYKHIKLTAGIGFQAQIFNRRTMRKTNIDTGNDDAYGENGSLVDEFPDAECDDFCGVEDNGQNAGDTIEESHGAQSNNPGYGGFSSYGAIYTTALWARFSF